MSTLCLCRRISINLFPCLQLVGLVKLSLHQFYLAFSEQSSADLCLEAEVRRREKERKMEKGGGGENGERRRKVGGEEGREGEREEEGGRRGSLAAMFVFVTSLQHQ